MGDSNEERIRVQIPLTATLKALLEEFSVKWDRSQAWVIVWALNEGFKLPKDFTNAVHNRFREGIKGNLKDNGEIVARLQVRLRVSTLELLQNTSPAFGCSPARFAALMAETVILSHPRMIKYFFGTGVGKKWVDFWAGKEDFSVEEEQSEEDFSFEE